MMKCHPPKCSTPRAKTCDIAITPSVLPAADIPIAVDLFCEFERFQKLDNLKVVSSENYAILCNIGMGPVVTLELECSEYLVKVLWYNYCT